jgi:hypothetical protein
MYDGAPELNPQAPQTVKARILPGWMPHDYAVEILTKQCVPGWQVDKAEQLWREYRDRVLNLPQRTHVHESLPFDNEDMQHVEQFMARMVQGRRNQHEIASILKLDLRSLIANQQLILTERSTNYAAMTSTQTEWRNEFLPLSLPLQQIGMKCAIGLPFHLNPLDTTIVYDLPGGEFSFLPQGNGLFAISELPRFAIARMHNRNLVLKNGYHRSLARILSSSPAHIPTGLVVLEGADEVEDSFEIAMPWLEPELPLPVMGDYTCEGMYLDVQIRRKRYQIEVQARWRALDDF